VNRALVINSEFLGRGDDELGAKLMTSFLRTLLTTEQKPDKLVFYNSGVKLLAEGTATREILEELHRTGVLLVACGTCVGYFKLDERIPKPYVSNMQEIVRILTETKIVVTV
jgi:selenium metabolism protein YedF